MTKNRRNRQRRLVESTTAAAPSAAGAKPRRGPGRLPIAVVVVGASAGGLEAMKRLVGAIPADSGIGFVLVPHLDPHRESRMVDLLAKQTRLPVCEARNGAAIEPNRVYLIPPNMYLRIDNGAIVLDSPPEESGRKPPIDFAFRSAAVDQGERSIGVVLSGSGAYGTEGAKEIKLAGGIVIAQDPDTAEFPEMPRSAVAAGVADYVLAPEEIPAALIAYARGAFPDGPMPRAAKREEGGLRRVLAVLQARSKVDFRNYRKGTLLRRIRRRMALEQVGDFAAYAEKLREDPAELTALRKDLLIGVTAFFRDEKAYALLVEHVVPELVARAGEAAAVRVWVVGCSTGEEAYSIAMLLLERFAAAGEPPRVQIFATDVDDAALGVARRGIYPESIAAAVSAERLERFFVREGEQGYRVTQQLRDAVLFAPQNLTLDPPLSNVSLISCRNVLIYLEPAAQAKVIELFHFALNEGGFLLLGPAETIGRATTMFEAVSKKWRLYRRIGDRRRHSVAIPITTPSAEPSAAALEPAPRRPPDLGAIAAKVLAAEFAPASVLVDRRYEVVSMQGPIAGYLEFPGGSLSQDLLMLARRGLRAPLRAICEKAASEGRTVTEPDVRVLRNGRYVGCRITARPLLEANEARGLVLVVFEDRATPTLEPAPDAGAEQTMLLRQLERELRATREDRHTIVETLESSNEQLKASNEEMMSMNEELRAANDDLDASKAELQALNEALATANGRLRDKIEDLDKTNSDLINLIGATDIATVFLDTDLKIKRFAASRLLNLMPSDVGRSFRELTPPFGDADLLADAERVIATSSPISKELAADGGRCYLRRVSPYLLADQRIGGAVITFVDVTQLRDLNAALFRRSAELAASEHRIRAVLDNAVDGIVTIDQTGAIETFNSGAEIMFGYSAREVVGRDAALLMPALHHGNPASYLERYRAAGKPRELKGLRRDGTEFPIHLSLGKIPGLGIYTGIVRDITEQKALQEEVVRVATLEQRRIGQELHDGTQQELAGLGLLARGLSEYLGARGESREAELAAKLAAGIAQTNRHVRDLSRGLVPIAIKASGLAAALGDLAKTTSERHGVSCRFEPGDVEIEDGIAATHLYRIAQEAVGNAVKHAKPDTVSIRLANDDDAVRLEIADDGVGIPEKSAHRGGLGLKIMEYRCSLIGGELTIGRRDGGGTLVVCTVPRPVAVDVRSATAG